MVSYSPTERVGEPQFELRITGSGITTGNVGLTSGSTTGLQTNSGAVAGPVLGVPGTTYTIGESGASGADLSNYDIDWRCIDTRNGAVVNSGAGTTGSFVMPPFQAGFGPPVVCTFHNVPHPVHTVTKSSDPAPGSAVSPGDTITYTITVANTGVTAYTAEAPASFVDDLGGVLDDGVFNDDATIVAGGGTLDYTTPLLSWEGPLAVGESVTITYSVTLAGTGTGDGVVANVVSGGQCPDPAITDPAAPGYDAACAPPPLLVSAVDIAKQIVGGPTLLANGHHQVVYELVVRNTGPGGAVYDLSDTLTYGDGVTVVAATVANTAPGTIATVPGWNGTTATAVATAVPLAGAVGGVAGEHVYTVTVELTTAPGLDPAAADCTLAEGEAGTGLRNVVDVTGAFGDLTAEACSPAPRTTLDKELTAIVPRGDGSFDLTYELTVTQTGAAGRYDLADELRLSEAVAVVDVGVANTVPGDIVVRDDFDGGAQPAIVGGVDIAAGDTHVYVIAVTVTIDLDAATFESSNCDLTAGESGTGAMNGATLTTSGGTVDASDCAPFPATRVVKSVVAGPTALGDGEYELVYTLTVTNDGRDDDRYELVDELTFGAGIVVESATVTGTDPDGIATDPSWDGIGQITIVADQPIAAGTLAGPATHVYTVRVVVSMPVTLPAEAADCTLAEGEAGTGLRNTATVSGGAGAASSADCVPAPSTTITKQIDAVTGNGDGTYTVRYRITVGRAGDGPAYTLTDAITYGAAVDVVDVEVVDVDPAGLVTNPGFDGVDDQLVAGDVAIADGEVHVYTVDVVVTVDGDAVTFVNSDCTLAAGEAGTGLLNTATLAVNDVTTADDDCVPPPGQPRIDKQVASGPTALGDDRFELVYTVTVSNPGAGDGRYDLVDALAFGDGITVVSAVVENTSPGGITTNPVWDGATDTTVVTDVEIAAASGDDAPTVHVYTVTVVADVDAAIAAGDADCAAGGGFANVATSTVNGRPDDAPACTPAPRTEFTKTLADAVPNGDGTTTLTYVVEISRFGHDGRYDLADAPAMSAAVAVLSTTVTAAPAGVALNPGFDGDADQVIASGVEIAADETHSYTLVVVIAPDLPTITFENSDCALTAGESGTGALNVATLTIDATERRDDACVELPATTVDKAITAGPTAVGSGRYAVTYTLTVRNSGAGGDRYDLADQLAYGDGVTVVDATANNTVPGDIDVNAAFDGQADTTIVTGQTIDAATAAGPAEHTYTVTVVFTTADDLTAAAADCALAEGDVGTGLANTATVVGAAGEHTADDCAPAPRTVFGKQLADITSNGDGTFVLTYVLTVAQTGIDAVYDLADELLLSEAVTVDTVGAVITTPGDLDVNAGFDGQTDTTIVVGQAIAAGATHTYTYVVTVSFDIDAVTFESSNCTLLPTESGTGAMNRATFSSNDRERTASDCAPFPATRVAKSVVAGPTALGDGEYELVYTLTVTNDGRDDDRYELVDELTFGAGIVVESATVIGTDPDDLVVDGSWDGVGQTTIVADQPIAGAAGADDPAVHVYTVRVVVSMPATLPAEAADCALAEGEAGTGLRNTATVTGGAGPAADDDCVAAPSTTITKQIDAVTGNGDGTYTVRYRIAVARAGDGPAYRLTDAITYGAAVDVVDVEVVATDPAGLATNAGFDGVDDQLVAADVAIADGETHVYTVDVDITVDGDAVTFANSDCTLAAGEAGTGLLNTATVTVNDTSDTDHDCAPPPGQPRIDKQVASGPTALGDGEYEIVYTITVANHGAGIGTYTLTDELRYGADVTVVSAVVENTTPGGITTNPTWDGVDETVVVAGASIAAATADDAPAVHVYTVTVVAAAPADIAEEAASCAADEATRGGFANSAQLVVNGTPDEDGDCVDVPRTSVAKQLATVTPNGDGTFTLVYTLTVSRTGDGPAYTLDDTLEYGAAVTVDGVFVADTMPAGLVVNTGFDGVTDTTIAADVAIDDGEQHVYQIVVDVTVEAAAVDFADSSCAAASAGSGAGFFNTATVTTNDTTTDDSDCGPLPGITIDKQVTSGPAPLGGGRFELIYTLIVTNAGAGAGVYSLDDTLTFGDGIAIESADVTNSDPDVVLEPGWNGVAATVVVIDQPIAGATAAAPARHTYTVTVVVTVPAELDPAAADCTLGTDETGTGLRNTATLGGDSGPAAAEACTAPPVTTFDKRLDTVTALGDSRFELVYELEVTRVSGGRGSYTLTDELLFGESLTVESVTVANVAPGDLDVNDDFDGVTDELIAADVAIDDGESHRYTVTIVAVVDVETSTPADSDCTLAPGEDGTGAMNRATLDTDGVVSSDQACVELPATVVSKTVSAGPTAIGNGEYEIAYTITVTNAGAGDDTYTLDDALTFGEGIAVVAATVVNTDPGDIAVAAGWDGLTDTRVVTDQPIAGGVDEATVHTYVVTVVAAVDPATTFAAGDCTLAGDEAGTGLRNTATLESSAGTGAAEACAPAPLTTLDKELLSITEGGDGTTTLVYELTVVRQGDGPAYTLTDELRYGPAITIGSVTVGNTVPGDLVTEAGFDGQGAMTIVADQAIADGVEHRYLVTVVATVDHDELTVADSQCPAGGGADRGAWLNTAVLSSNDVEIDARACAPTAGRAELTIAKTSSATSIDRGGTVRYTIIVTNTGIVEFTAVDPAEIVDDLGDVLDDAVWLGDAAASSGTASFSAPLLTWRGPLAVGESVTITYSVRMRSDAASSAQLYNVVTAVAAHSNCPSGSTAAACRTVTNVVVPPAPPAPVTPDPIPVTG